jgi:hypothetical protein
MPWRSDQAGPDQFTDKAVDIFARLIAVEQQPCTCAPHHLNPCPACARWREVHIELYHELEKIRGMLAPWDIWTVQRPGDGQQPRGSWGDYAQEPNEVAQARYRALAAAVAKRKAKAKP